MDIISWVQKLVEKKNPTISPGDLEETGEEIIGAIRESQRELEKQIGHLGNQFGQIPDQLSDIEDLIKDMRAAEEAADAKRRKSIGCAQVTE
jgi:chromosome segregation ATPase